MKSAATLSSPTERPNESTRSGLRLDGLYAPLKWLVPASLAVIAGHTLGRGGLMWRFEWDWAIWNYYFAVVLLVPLAAGIGAWQGARLSRAIFLLRLSPRSWALLSRLLALSARSVLLPFFAGFLSLWFLLGLTGLPGGPSGTVLAGFVPAALQLLLALTFGLVLGLLLSASWSVPLAAVLSFMIVILLYVTGQETIVVAGGATSSIYGLEPRLDRMLFQVGFLLLAEATLLTLVALHLRRGRVSTWVPVILMTALAAVASTLPSPGVFSPVEAKLSCVSRGSAQFCGPPGYGERIAAVAADLSPAADGLLRLDGSASSVVFRSAVPSAETATTTQRQELVGALPPRLLAGAEEETVGALISPWVEPCLLRGEGNQAHYDAVAVIAFKAEMLLGDSAAALRPTAMQPSDQEASAAMALLRRCARG